MEDTYYPIDQPNPLGTLSLPLPVRDLIFRHTTSDFQLDYHCAPCRQYVICLDASVEVETSDGKTNIIPPGGVLLVEDTTGRGHKSRAVNGKPRTSIFIPIDETRAKATKLKSNL